MNAYIVVLMLCGEPVGMGLDIGGDQVAFSHEAMHVPEVGEAVIVTSGIVQENEWGYMEIDLSEMMGATCI